MGQGAAPAAGLTFLLAAPAVNPGENAVDPTTSVAEAMTAASCGWQS